jgi:hypothetical protein
MFEIKMNQFVRNAEQFVVAITYNNKADGEKI